MFLHIFRHYSKISYNLFVLFAYFKRISKKLEKNQVTKKLIFFVNIHRINLLKIDY